MKRFRMRIATACLLAVPALALSARYVDIPLTDVRDHAFDKHGMLYITSGTRLMAYDTDLCALHERFNAPQALIGVDVSADSEWIAVAAQGAQNGSARFYYNRQGHMRRFAPWEFPSQTHETGSYMPAWNQSNRLLLTGTFGGSGWVPFREFNFVAGNVAALTTLTQSSMLTRSTGSSMIAVAESNISSGPIRAFDSSINQFVASANLQWFVYDVAVNGSGTRYVAPTYNGAYVLDRVGGALVQSGLLGQYADHGPVGAVFSPDSSKLFTANWSFASPAQRGLKLLDAQSLQPIASLDSYAYPWSGNAALGQGRLTMDRAGRYLAATISNGVRLYDVSAELGLSYPATCATQIPTTAGSAEVEADLRNLDIDARGWRVGQAPQKSAD